MTALMECLGATSSSTSYLQVVQAHKNFQDCLRNESTYSPLVLPTIGYFYDVANGGSRDQLYLTIDVWMTLYNILSLSNAGTLSISMELYLRWLDPNIKCSFGGTEIIESSLLWTPVLRVMNPAEANSTFPVDPTVVVKQSLNDTNSIPIVFAKVMALISSTCEDINLVSFPFDVQTCATQFIVTNSYGFTNFRILNELNQVLPGATDSEWQLEKLDIVQSAVTLDNTTYQSFNVSLTMRRKSFYYMLYLILPTVILQSLMAMVFVVPTDDGAKLGLSATFVLVLYVLYDSIINMTPQFEQSQTPHIVVSLIVALSIGFLSMIESTLLQTLHIIAPGLPESVNKFAIWLFITRWKRNSAKVDVDADNLQVDNDHGKSSLQLSVLSITAETEGEHPGVQSAESTSSSPLTLTPMLKDRADTPDSSDSDVLSWYLKRLLECQRNMVEIERQNLLDRRRKLENLETLRRKHEKLKLIASAWKRFEYAISICTLIAYICLAAYFFGPYLYS